MPFTPSRRAAAAMFGGLALSPLLPRLSSAQRYLDVHGGGNFTPVNVAIVTFAGEGGAPISSVIVNNFRRSVFINPVDAGAAGAGVSPDAAPEHGGLPGAQRPICRARPLGARPRRPHEDRIPPVGRRRRQPRPPASNIVTDPKNSRRVAHIISDAIFSKVTGEGGFFDTRIAFVDESGPRQNRTQKAGDHGPGRRQSRAI